MQDIFSKLSLAIENSWYIALSAAFIWGVLSILLSPCHLSSIPLIIGFINGQGKTSTKKAFALALLFSVGILVTIAIIGLITSCAGRIMGDIGKYGNYFVAAIFFVIGLHLMEVFSLPMPGKSKVGMKSKGFAAAFLLGLIFGIALGPCTFAYMAPMLGIVFKLSSTKLAYGISLLIAYGIGHCSVIVIAGASVELVQKYMNWNEQSKSPKIIKRICGAFVIIGGLWLLYIAK